MKSNFYRKIRNSGAFTLVELLVVLAIVVVLASLALPGLTRAQGQSRQAQCTGNLRQLTLAELVYAGENADRLPSGLGAGAWPWDISPVITGAMNNYGAGRQQLYCPANPDQNSDGLWNIGMTASPQYRVAGYVFTFPGSTITITNTNPLATPQQTVIAGVFLSPQPATKRVLVADAIISQSGQNNTAQKLNYTYTGIAGGFPTPHRTSHLDYQGKYPTGGNVGMLDGHVEWSPFSNVVCRTQGSVPGFWW